MSGAAEVRERREARGMVGCMFAVCLVRLEKGDVLIERLMSGMISPQGGSQGLFRHTLPHHCLRPDFPIESSYNAPYSLSHWIAIRIHPRQWLFTIGILNFRPTTPVNDHIFHVADYTPNYPGVRLHCLANWPNRQPTSLFLSKRYTFLLVPGTTLHITSI